MATNNILEDKYLLAAKELVKLGVKYDSNFDDKLAASKKSEEEKRKIRIAYCCERLPNVSCCDLEEVSRIYGVLHSVVEEMYDGLITDRFIDAGKKLVEEGMRLLESSFGTVKKEFETHNDKKGLQLLVDGLLDLEYRKGVTCSNNDFYPFEELAYPIARQMERVGGEGKGHRIDEIRSRLQDRLREYVQIGYGKIFSSLPWLYKEHCDTEASNKAGELLLSLKRPEEAYKFFKASDNEVRVLAALSLIKEKRDAAGYQKFLKENKEKDPGYLNEIVSKTPELGEFTDVLKQFV